MPTAGARQVTQKLQPYFYSPGVAPPHPPAPRSRSRLWGASLGFSIPSLLRIRLASREYARRWLAPALLRGGGWLGAVGRLTWPRSWYADGMKNTSACLL